MGLLADNQIQDFVSQEEGVDITMTIKSPNPTSTNVWLLCYPFTIAFKGVIKIILKCQF